MVKVFVVMLTIGKYDDAHTSAHKVFVGSDDAFAGAWRARHYVESSNRRVAEINGVLHSVARLMEEWEKSHMHPLDGRDDRDGWLVPSTEEEDAASQAWREARDAERTRLFDLFGVIPAMKEANVPEHERDIWTTRIEMRYFIADPETVEVESY